METRTTTSTPRATRSAARRQTALAAALFLIAGFAIGAWQVKGHHSHPGTTVGGSSVVSVPSVVAEAAQNQYVVSPPTTRTAPLALAYSPAVRPAVDRLTVYVVGSDDESDQVRLSLRSANALASQAGYAAPASAVLVMNPGDTDGYAAARVMLDLYRTAIGPTALTVADLRSSGLSTPVEAAPRPQETNLPFCDRSGSAC